LVLLLRLWCVYNVTSRRGPELRPPACVRPLRLRLTIVAPAPRRRRESCVSQTGLHLSALPTVAPVVQHEHEAGLRVVPSPLHDVEVVVGVEHVRLSAGVRFV